MFITALTIYIILTLHRVTIALIVHFAHLIYREIQKEMLIFWEALE